MTFAVKVIRRLGTWQYLISHIVFMLNFIIIIMVWVEVPLLVVGVWRIVCSTVEGFICRGLLLVMAAIGQLIKDS